MKPTAEVCLSPALLHLHELSGKIVVVIDIFRATSTITTALYNGATKVIPVTDVELCKQLGASTENCITAGERGGKVIEGLMGGNSPLEYTKERVEGKTLILTTTNGTKLLHMAKEASQILIGSFLNLNRISEYLLAENKDVVLACAGWMDQVNFEDSLFAGYLCKSLSFNFELLGDNALMTENLAQHTGSVTQTLSAARHFKRLQEFGFQKDIEHCCTLNHQPVLPIFDKTTGEITLKDL